MSNDKVEATFYDGGLSEMYDRLAKAIERDRWRKIRMIAYRNVLTTLCITAGFVLCLLVLGAWGYLPAILTTASFFTWRDVRTFRRGY